MRQFAGFCCLTLSAALALNGRNAVAQSTAPPLTAATASPGILIRFAGQILDVQHGFVFFTTGDAFALAAGARIVDYAGGSPSTLTAQTRMFARATFDGPSGRIVELALSQKRIASEASYGDIKRFAVVLSPPLANPDLRSGGAMGMGKAVLVTFTVQVPATTPLSDVVYIATDVSGWSADAIKMDRVDALHYRITRNLDTGTKLLYQYTRGSWTSGERNQFGMRGDPRKFTVGTQDVIRRDDIVYHWADEDAGNPANSAQGIPTPFNPHPFATPIPTPRPTRT